MLGELDRYSDKAHHWVHTHPTTGVPYTIEVCSTVKKYLLKGFIGHHKLRIKPFYLTEFQAFETDNEMIKALKDGSNYEGIVEGVKFQMLGFLKVTMVFKCFSPVEEEDENVKEEDKKEEEMAIEGVVDANTLKEERAKVKKIFETIYSVSFTLPLIDRASMGNPEETGVPLVFKRSAKLLTEVGGYSEKVLGFLNTEALSRESMGGEPMIKKVLKVIKDDTFFKKMSEP